MVGGDVTARQNVAGITEDTRIDFKGLIHGGCHPVKLPADGRWPPGSPAPPPVQVDAKIIWGTDDANPGRDTDQRPSGGHQFAQTDITRPPFEQQFRVDRFSEFFSEIHILPKDWVGEGEHGGPGQTRTADLTLIRRAL